MFSRRYFAVRYFGSGHFGNGGAGPAPDVSSGYFAPAFFGRRAFGAPYFGPTAASAGPSTFVDDIPKFWHVPYLRRDWPITPEFP